MSDPAWHVIVNPESGGGRGSTMHRRLQRALAAARIEARIGRVATAAAAAQWIADCTVRGVRRFAVAGGDGTAHAVLNVLVALPEVRLADFTLAVLPLGTGNDWARSLDVPRDIDSAARLLVDGRIETHDVGVLHCDHAGRRCERYFLNMAGAGFDAHVLRLTATSRASRWTYFAGIARGARSFHARELTVRAAALEHRGPTLVVVASLGRYLGGGMRVAPAARSDDGLFDVTLVSDMSAASILAHVPRLLLGTLAGSAHVRTLQTAELAIDGDAEVEADGELVGHLPATVRVLPRALNVVTGRAAHPH